MSFVLTLRYCVTNLVLAKWRRRVFGTLQRINKTRSKLGGRRICIVTRSLMHYVCLGAILLLKTFLVDLFFTTQRNKEKKYWSNRDKWAITNTNNTF